MNGVLVLDKPGDVTSHDMVQYVRKLFKTSKVGHLGTLDPMATGVLPVCVGKATRIAQFLPSSPKEYIGEIRFGFATSTYDRQGTATGPEMPFDAAAEEVGQAMAAFLGKIEQIPPAISAKKIGGDPSYKLARRGLPVQNAPVAIEVHAFELTGFAPPVASFRVVCSPGTYVRSLAHDLGVRFGCGAHLASLRRLQSGPFRIEDAVRSEHIKSEVLIPLENLLTDLPMVEADPSQEDRVAHGNPIPAEGLSGLARIFNKKGKFLAVAEVESGWAHPRVVLTSLASVESQKAR